MNQGTPTVNQKHSVKVNNGSGVLIQPMSTTYAYVLTAKHCLKVDKDDLTSNFISKHELFSFDGKEIPVLDVICHDTRDIAILIVGQKSECELMINSDSLVVNDQVFLCGYPDDRRGTSQEYSAFIYNFTYMSGEFAVLSPEAAGVGYSNVSGFSGGGIFTLDREDKPVLLCGIETKMDGDPDRECHGNISAIPISEFEKLIADPKNLYLEQPLAPLLPLHLSSFEHLRDFSFDVIQGWIEDDKLNFLKDRLRDISTNEIQVNLSPSEVFKEFKECLRVYNRPSNELRSRELWVALMELLTISILIDKPKIVDAAYVDNIMHSRRLIYIGVKETWQQHVSDIFKGKLNRFNENGIIVVKTLCSPQRNVSFSKVGIKKLVKNIARPPSDRRAITNINSNLSKIHSIVDITALHAECIESKEDVFENHTDLFDFDDKKEAELRMLLAKEYGAYLTVKDIVDVT
ncbi:trypsin-like peptidase domain-containing protein [Moritella sp. 36]|uniref:ABC-three component system protein n=1 Tax=Moritella sp. 36 TaxID=2746233 RepID=UPI001BAD44FA|nr:ABC-three component system protein [Moritella sp. 36]QUM90560.1 trypsin-like peptidase domain-containing protein [Moritella sp. 36]